MIQRSRTLLPWLAALGLGLSVTALAGPVRAQSTCATDADCAEGLLCQVVGGVACAEPACPPGETCPEPLPCTPEEFFGCVPGPCTSDADCGEGLRCLTSTVTECSGGGAPCVEGQECPAPEPPDCTTRSESLCAPAWFAPCDTAADCGAGFECVPEEQCSCGGSTGGGTGGASSTDGGAPEPADCVCEPTGVNRCQPVRSTCTAASDCPAGWTCAPDPEASVCSGGGGTGGSTGVGGAGGVSAAGAPGEPDPCTNPPPVEDVCVPPYAEIGGGGVGLGSGNEGGEVTYGPPRSDTGSNPVSSGDTGGCALAPARSTGTELAFLGVLTALGLAGAARRRR